MLKETKLPGFLLHEKNGLVLATTRVKVENQNPENLIVLSPKHPITKMILRDFHTMNHRGVQHCVARSRIYYWIPQAAKLMKSIVNKCFSCRVMNAEAMKQLMSPLPEYRLKASPVWHYSMLDLFGPIEVTKELRSKCLTSVCVQSQQSVQNNWELKIRILRIRLASFTTKITIISKET